MTKKRSNQDPQDALDRLTVALVEDILSASDDDIIAEARDDLNAPANVEAATLTLFEKAATLAAKNRLVAARLAVASDRRPPPTVGSLDPVEARRRLAHALINDPNLTLAARRGQGHSDEDVQGMLEDLKELGIIPESDADTDKPQ